MKFRRLMAASMAGVMAVSSSIVCQVTASAAAQEVDITAYFLSDTGITVEELSKYESLKVTYQPQKAASCNHSSSHKNGETYCPWGAVIFVGGSIDGISTPTDSKKDGWYQPDSPAKIQVGGDTQEITGSVNVSTILDSITSDSTWSESYTLNTVKVGGWDATAVKVVGVTKDASDVRTDAVIEYDGSPIVLTKKTEKDGSTAVSANVQFNLDGITTLGDLQGKYKNVTFRGIKYISDSFGLPANCFHVQLIYMSKQWDWQSESDTALSTSGKSVSWYTDAISGDSTNEINDLGYQIYVNMADLDEQTKNEISALDDNTQIVLNPAAASVDNVKITAADGSAVNTEVTFGDEITLKADVTPADADGADKVEWSSDDPDVAEVSTDGKISFKKAGKVVITAKAGGKSDSVTFNVAKKTFTYNGGWNNVPVDGTKDLDTLLKAEADSFNIIPASSPYVSLVNGKDYTASAQVAADKKSYDLTVKLIGDAADNYELTNPTFKGGYIYYHMSSMALNKTSLNLIAGGKGEALTAVTTPDNALLDDLKIIYESTDPTVATVDSDGNVTPVKAGTATIKVTATANAIVGQAVDHVVTKTAECQVTVTDVAIPATKINLDAKEKTLTAGDKIKLTATVTPADSTDSVTWKSSAESVAAVDKDGNVTAKAAGTATITATAGEYSAECTVTVKAKEPDIVPDDNKYTSIPKTSTKIDSVATTINSDGTRNMLAVFYISDEDAKACDMLAVTIQRQDGKEFSKKLYLENFFDSISYTNGDKIYQGSAKGSNHYVAMKFLNVDPEWGSITIKIEPIIAKG